MSTWVTPATFVAANILTAAQLNATRDNLNFLKGFADLITNSTTADTGNSVIINILRSVNTAVAYQAGVTGDTLARYVVRASGVIEWGTGSLTADTNLYRLAANQLATDDEFVIGNTGSALNLGGAGYITFVENTAPGVGAGNTCRLYADDNGAGKTRLMAVFSSGAAQQVAIQP